MATETAPEVNEANDRAVEDKLAAAFEKSGVKDPPPEVDEDEEPEPEAKAEEATEEETTEESAPEEAVEEVEYEGKQYALPKELKDALLRQQDYTKKTQEVADRRRQIEEREAQVELVTKFREENFSKSVEAHALYTRLQQYSKVNWEELADANPAQYLKLDREHRQIQEAFNRTQAEMQNIGQEFQAKLTETRQRAQAKCIEELKRDIKDFGPELLRKLDDTGSHFGFSGTELAAVTDPRMIRVLHAAMKYQELQKAGSLARKQVQDVKPVQVKTARSAQTSQATTQLNEARDRLRKTGKASDAEAFLAARFAKSMR
jgi:hypothetical protein